MTLDDIIHELRTSTGVPKEAMRAGVAEAPALRPRIDALAAKLVDGVWLVPEDEQLMFYGLHVLAAARDTAIWPRLADILKLPDADIDRTFERTVFRDSRSSRAIALIFFLSTKCARRTFPIVSTEIIPPRPLADATSRMLSARPTAAPPAQVATRASRTAQVSDG